MTYKVLYRKYRPTNFSEIVGQKTIVEALINSIKNNKLAHAYIFDGPRGTGKTSTAKIFAKVLTCLNPIDGNCCNECNNCMSFNENPDIIEIDAASNNGVDEIREIRNNVKLVPNMSKYKVYIIDEAHMLSTSAWNAFLKTLEEPPSHVVFIFATTDVQKIPTTVLSRCQRYDFHKLLDEEVVNHLKSICTKEKIMIDEDALSLIAKIGDGCLRDCLSYLDQLSKLSTSISADLVMSTLGITSNEHIIELLNSIKDNDVLKLIELINNIKETGIDFNTLINNIIDFLVKESVNYKLGKESYVSDFSLAKDLVDNLFDVQIRTKNADNPYDLLLMSLLNYFKEPEKTENKPKKPIKNEKSVGNNISREIILDDYVSQLKKIRINNSFFNASKEYKNEMKELWDIFVKSLGEKNEYTLIGYINNVSIEVVSPENVLFSTPVESDSIIFNNNLETIETEFKRITRKDYKFICISFEEWKKEKKDFIENKDKEREYIKEDKLKKNFEKETITKEAEDIFGDIIEVK